VKEIRIINQSYFEETINSAKRVEKVNQELKKDQEIHNSQIVVNYSEEGLACFEIIMHKPNLLILSFIGTAC
jgi:hypothetical protein